MPTLAVSSFSLHRRLGPLHLERRDDNGDLQPVVFPLPQEETLEDFIGTAKERLGLKTVELCQLQFQDTSPEYFGRLAELLKEQGVKVLTVPIDIGNLTTAVDEHRADDIARISQWFQIARDLGASYVRVNAGAPSGSNNEVSGKVVDALGELADKAQSLGMSLLVENHGGASSDPDFILNLLDEVGHDRLGLLLDLGNFEPLIAVSRSRLGGNPISTEGIDTATVYKNIERLAPVASLVHAKAFDPADDGSPLLDLPRALEIVEKSGYAGSITVEWEGQEGDPWEQAATTVATVRAVFPELA